MRLSLMITRTCQYSTMAVITLLFFTLNTSCKKQLDIDSLPIANKPPLANAGSNKALAAPGYGMLDGNGSTDPDNDIIVYSWTKISGPANFSIAEPNAAKTEVYVSGGIFLFELRVKDIGGLFSMDTVQVSVSDGFQPANDNVIFFFRDTTGGLDAESISTIESFSPRIVLVNVQIENYPIAEIEGVWSLNYTPRCPGSSNYTDATSFGSFDLPPGTYKWVAESVITDLSAYPVPASFRQYWGAGPHKAEGMITVNAGDCLVKEIIFK